MKARFNDELENAKSEFKRQIEDMTTRIKELSMNNKNLQERFNRGQVNGKPNYQQSEDSDMNPSISEAVMLGFT